MKKAILLFALGAIAFGGLQARTASGEDNTIAATFGFTGTGGGGNGTPMAATTSWGNLFLGETDADQLNTATHELFHGIGFTTQYTNFDNNVFFTPNAGTGPIPAGSRVYSTNGTVGGILMVLTPANQGTHADPNATGAGPWPATGYNQANDIMQPALMPGATLNATDEAVLQNAFGWGSVQGITINVINDDPQLTAENLTNINNAVTAVENLFNTNVPGPGEPNFTWTLVPEPSSIAIIGLFAAAALVRRRRTE